ncbi:MAG: TetR/AcrR family transcriptional regulator [Ktedonobacteraceae bacterium]
MEQQNAGETRRTILHVAERLFATYGYRAVTTRQIADACGITQPALYRHFADKQDLYIAIITASSQQLNAVMERIMLRQRSVHERLRLIALYMLNATQHDLSMMFHDIRYELTPDARAKIEQSFAESAVQPLTAIFEDGISRGVLRSPEQGGIPAPMAAYLFLNLVSNVIAQMRDHDASGVHYSHAQRAQMIIQLHLHGLANPEVEDPN